MPTNQKTYELKNESLKGVLNYIAKETRRQKNIKRKPVLLSEKLASRAKEDALHYDKSAKAVLVNKRFLQVYPFKLNLRYSIKYIADTIKDVLKAKFERMERNKIFKVFFREMSVILKSGIQLVPALMISKEHTSSKRFKEILERVIYDLKANGTSFSKSISRFPNYFTKFYLSIIKAGEKSCTLPAVFEELAGFEEKAEIMRNKIKNAMTYPMFVFVFSMAMLFLLSKMLTPAILSLSKDFDFKGAAAVIVFISGVFSYPLTTYAIITLAMFLFVLCYSYIKTPEGSYLWDRFKIKIPVLGDCLKKVYVIQFCIIFYTLHKAGISVSVSTRILSEVFENSYIRDQLNKNVFPAVNEGYPLSGALKDTGFFPPVAIQLIATGEESGCLAQMLKKLIEIYKFEVENTLVRLSNVLEPFIIVVFGALVCFIAVISMIPIYQIIPNF